MIEAELNRITEAKEKLSEAAEEKAIEASRKRLARRAAEAGRKQTANRIDRVQSTRERKVRPSITRTGNADGRVEVLDPDRPGHGAPRPRRLKGGGLKVDRGRSRNGRIISAVCQMNQFALDDFAGSSEIHPGKAACDRDPREARFRGGHRIPGYQDRGWGEIARPGAAQRTFAAF